MLNVNTVDHIHDVNPVHHIDHAIQIHGISQETDACLIPPEDIEDDIPWKTVYDGRTFYGRQPFMEDYFGWKTTLDGR